VLPTAGALPGRLSGRRWLVAHRSGVLLYLLVALPTAGLFVRLFIVQHDCGHGSFWAAAA
jgi:omega-6 fatty acid desaturase (delta-12 desaturase)